MNIYFAGSIRGGREDIELYRKIVKHLENFGTVLTEHVADSKISSYGETTLTEEEIYSRDLDWLTSSDVVIAEVSTPSLGVGFEVAKAVELNKKVLCLYRKQAGKRVSAMIAGCPELQLAEYETLKDALSTVDSFIK